MVQCFGVAIALAVFAVGGAQPLPVPIVESITELLQGSNAGPCPVSIASCSFVFVPNRPHSTPLSLGGAPYREEIKWKCPAETTVYPTVASSNNGNVHVDTEPAQDGKSTTLVVKPDLAADGSTVAVTLSLVGGVFKNTSLTCQMPMAFMTFFFQVSNTQNITQSTADNGYESGASCKTAPALYLNATNNVYELPLTVTSQDPASIRITTALFLKINVVSNVLLSALSGLPGSDSSLPPNTTVSDNVASTTRATRLLTWKNDRLDEMLCVGFRYTDSLSDSYPPVYYNLATPRSEVRDAAADPLLSSTISAASRHGSIFVMAWALGLSTMALLLL